MIKVLTKSGIFQTTSEGTARSIAVNAARSGESVVIVTAQLANISFVRSRGVP